MPAPTIAILTPSTSGSDPRSDHWTSERWRNPLRVGRLPAVLARLGAVMLLALAFAAPARAADWSAALIQRSPDATVESGEVLRGQFMEFRNTGTATWTRPGFKLGTAEPYNRTSAFADPSWLDGGRTATLNVQAVAQGQTGRFDYVVRAPSVAATTKYVEAFEPVLELVSWTLARVYVTYTVLPSLPPTVGFTSVPAQVARGGALDVAADVSDNGTIDRVEFSVGSTTVSATTHEGATYGAQLPTDALATGPQTVVVRAVDRAGNFATATAGFTVAPLAGTADRDGDGVLSSADCDDTNSAVHPGATEVPGNGVDDDCTGGDALATVASTVQNNWVAGQKSTRVTALRARNVPAGATIETRCSGGGCPFALKRLAVAKAGDVDLRKRYFAKSRFRVGAVIEVRILAPNRIAKVARFTIRRNKTPLSRYLCLAPGAKKATACS
jgi:hypothetical protein